MSNLENNCIFGQMVLQNQQDFVLGIFSIDQILKFTKYTKRLIVSYDEDNLPIYNEEIQREVESERVEKIADFLINDPEATFPTNIVLHIPEQVIENKKIVTIHGNDYLEICINNKVFEEIKKEASVADIFITIIDGQHRICGIEKAIERLKSIITDLSRTNRISRSDTIEKKLNYYKERLQSLLNIELVVSFFIDKTLEYQAMIFSTINRTQKRVTQNLVYSLFGLSSMPSPQKTALEIVLALNGHEKSPFFKRIILYGGEYEKFQSPPLSQATMVRSIVDLISENLRESENDRFRIRKGLFSRSSSSTRKLPFRNYYAADQDSKISDILFYFFHAVRNTFTDSLGKSLWDFPDKVKKLDNVLQTTIGYQALLKILVDILDELPEEKRFSTESYQKYLMRAKSINLSDMKRYPFANKTKNVLYFDISLNIWPTDKGDDERIEKLNKLLKE